MHFHREVGSLLRAVSQSHGGNHVALCRDAHARSSAQRTLVLDFLPQMIFGAFHLVALRVGLDLLHDQVDFLQFHIHDVVHDALCHLHMFAEFLVVEISIFGEGVHHIFIEIDRQQSA